MTDTEVKTLTGATPREIADAIIEALDSKSARDIKLLRVNDKTVVTDYFVICTANSSTQVKSLSGEIEYRLGERGLLPAHVEGYDGGTWVAMDYLHVIVHIFHRDQREFYKLEKVWADAEDIPITTTEK